jgi:hypothetical protein
MLTNFRAIWTSEIDPVWLGILLVPLLVAIVTVTELVISWKRRRSKR